MYSFCLSLFLSKWESMTETQQFYLARDSNFLGKLKLTSGRFIQVFPVCCQQVSRLSMTRTLQNQTANNVDRRHLKSSNKTRLWKSQDLHHYFQLIRWKPNVRSGSNSSPFLASNGYYFNTRCPALAQVINNSMFFWLSLFLSYCEKVCPCQFSFSYLFSFCSVKLGLDSFYPSWSFFVREIFANRGQ